MRSIDEQFGILRDIRNFDKMKEEAKADETARQVMDNLEEYERVQEPPVEDDEEDVNIDQVEMELSRYIDPVRSTVEHLNDELDALENQPDDEINEFQPKELNDGLDPNKVYVVTGENFESKKEPTEEVLQRVVSHVNMAASGGIVGSIVNPYESKKAAEGNAKYKQTKEVALGLLEQIGDSDILSEGQKISLLTEIYRTSIELLKERWGVNL